MEWGVGGVVLGSSPSRGGAVLTRGGGCECDCYDGCADADADAVGGGTPLSPQTADVPRGLGRRKGCKRRNRGMWRWRIRRSRRR
jgi:hypothetical protein